MASLSSNGLNFIKRFEGCHLYWYELDDGGLTCGYGHYVPHSTAKKQGIKKGTKITQKQADDFLRADMQRFVDGTNTQLKNFGHTVNQNQFDTLVSYAFNRGIGNKAGTNGLRQLLKNSKTVPEISANIVKYWGSNLTYKKGLLNRRRAEKVLFDTPMKATATPVKPSAPGTASTHIGVVTVIAPELNVRSADSVASAVVKQVGKGSGWKVYAVGKWGYRIGKNMWVAKGKAYVSYKPL